jgi:hypothetical protein
MERGDDRYVVATYLAMKRVFPKGGRSVFTHLMYGQRENAENVRLPARTEARKKWQDGYTTLFFRARDDSTKGKIDGLTRKIPESWRANNPKRRWPATVQNAMRTLDHDIVEVMGGTDDAARTWLDNMAGCIAQAVRAPGIFEKVGPEKTLREAEILKLKALRYGLLAREEAYVIEKILPAIDGAVPVK